MPIAAAGRLARKGNTMRCPSQMTDMRHPPGPGSGCGPPRGTSAPLWCDGTPGTCTTLVTYLKADRDQQQMEWVVLRTLSKLRPWQSLQVAESCQRPPVAPVPIHTVHRSQHQASSSCSSQGSPAFRTVQQHPRYTEYYVWRFLRALTAARAAWQQPQLCERQS
jgi:hypothetical protein